MQGMAPVIEEHRGKRQICVLVLVLEMIEYLVGFVKMK